MWFVYLFGAAAQAECDPDDQVLEDATFVDGSCVYEDWEPYPYDCDTCTVDDAVSKSFQWVNNWFYCGPGSSAAMVQVRAHPESNDTSIWWYGEDGELIGLSAGASGPYCCDDQAGYLKTYVTGGVPMQTCYAPIPFRLPEMERAGECYSPPSGCSAVGTSGSGGVLTISLGLMLLWRRRDV